MKAPELAIARWLNGKPVKPAALRGKVVVVGLWSGSTADEDKVFSTLVELERSYRSRGLTVLGIVSHPWDETRVRKLVLDSGARYPIGLDRIDGVSSRNASSTALRFGKAAGNGPVYIIDRKGFLHGVFSLAEADGLVQALLEQ
jgi:hypothetical protein